VQIVCIVLFYCAGGAEVLPKEVRVTRFKQLLLEGGVNAFSLYAKVKAKLDKDERCKHVTYNQFVAFCCDRHAAHQRAALQASAPSTPRCCVQFELAAQ
jgi:hypothetical protein